jgi:hypothetical protein
MVIKNACVFNVQIVNRRRIPKEQGFIHPINNNNNSSRDIHSSV